MTPAQDPEPGAGVRPYLQAGLTGGDGGPAPPDVDPSAALRPFVLTSGRVVGVDPAIGMETQVTVHDGPPHSHLPSSARELHAIVALCVNPLSVAEISARLRMHLGVTRVLVGDLRATGHLDVHTLDVADPRDPETIRRVIRGLRAIS
ncbi:DUF742 domain-containing protein [Asanoa siamensis]|uniref:DUF742 domain-containing protein n=1 Tax=Asanoa siamensis TaxID=926357 RepID=A0ABQ4CZW7_9ACTN|nr:DUF742 domain-containing protein [Asanoa siamensis]GIF76846.1 hypothetical protein Asi02nite_63640 [Asanoa siamensis]